MKKKSIYLFVFLSIYSCKTFLKKPLEKESLPPITQTGAHTLGFLYQEKAIIPTPPQSSGFGTNFGKKTTSLETSQYHFKDKSFSLSIQAKSYSKNLANLKIYIYNATNIGIGHYLLDEGGEIYTPTHNYIYVLAISPSTKKWTRYYSYKNSGKITISRKDNHVISGIFHAKLQNEAQTETIKLESGRFDININETSE